MAQPLTEEKLAEIRERTKAATPGPWEAWEATRSDTGDLVSVRMGDTAYWTPDSTDYQPGLPIGERRELAMRDAEFIVAARQYMPLLLAEVERQRAAFRTLEDSYVRVVGYDGERIAELEGKNAAMREIVQAVVKDGGTEALPDMTKPVTVTRWVYECIFCRAAHEVEAKVEHPDGCPVTKAKALLASENEPKE